MLNKMQTCHRPWPLPRSPWIMSQVWHDLLFAHWPVPVDVLHPFIPGNLTLDMFQGQAWLAVVPFHMSGVCPRFTPSIPGVSAFIELNVRTYVTLDDKPGVLFLSLDAAHHLAVKAARWLYRLPYFWAKMQIQPQGDGFQYQSQRYPCNGPSAELKVNYRPIAPVVLATPGSIEHWFTERYCLYTSHPNGALYRCEIHHNPWPLQQAEAEFHINTMGGHGIDLSQEPAYLHFSKRLNVAIWPLWRLR